MFNQSYTVRFLLGLALVVIGVFVLLRGKASGFVFDAEGLEAIIRGLVDIVIGFIFVITSFRKKSAVNFYIEAIFLIGLIISTEFLAHFVWFVIPNK